MSQISPPPPRRAALASPGGKASRLLELQRAGFKVPAFVCAPADVEDAIRTLGVPLAVRSSASAEDGRNASFAGQFKSFLGLRTAEEVTSAIAACGASVREESVVRYCRDHGIDPGVLEMTAIIQRQIEPELAGVAFTINPVNGREEVVIEACEGLAEDLLQGSVTALPMDHPLMKRHVREITETAEAIQRYFGEPQDIEFAIQDGELFILQARPITRIGFSPDTGEWTNADFRDGGVSCTVCTPLMWSLYDYIWQDALTGFLREIKLLRRSDPDFTAARLFFGRPYWNLGAVKSCLSRLPGFIERKFDEDLQVRVNYEGDGIVTPWSLNGLLRAIPVARAVSSVWKRQAEFDRQFLAGGFQALTARFENIPPSEADASFPSLIEEAYRVTETNYFRTVFCASLAKLTFAEAFPEADDTALVGGLPPLSHLEPLRVMREMKARGETDVSGLMREFRHHSRNELDLRTPRWDEDREWVEATLEHLSPQAGRDARAAYDEALARALAAIPRRQHRSFRKKLGRLRHFLWLREEMRDLSTRLYYLIRRSVLAIADARGLGDDVFFMSWQEIAHDKRAQVGRKRHTFESFRHFRAPNEIGGPFRATPVAPATGTLQGIGASPGTVRGPAFAARDINEAMQAPAGAILVCPYTDPGWTSVLGKISAVVTENGGLLSHAAVICREYGIPAVLGIPDATSSLVTGSHLEVDGASGIVSRLTTRCQPTTPS